IPVCCILYNLPCLLLRVITTVRNSVISKRGPAAMTDKRLFPLRACDSESGIFLYLYPPSLVISQVPVEDIELVKSHDIKIPFYLINSKEVTADVKVQPPVAEPRSVSNVAGRHCCCSLSCQATLRLDLRRKQLSYCLNAPEKSFRRRRFQKNAPACHRKDITLGILRNSSIDDHNYTVP